MESDLTTVHFEPGFKENDFYLDFGFCTLFFYISRIL